MSEPIDTQQTVEDDLATRVEERRGPGSPWAEALRELGELDRAVYRAVSVTTTPHLDDAFRRLSTAANYSRLWLGLSAVFAAAYSRVHMGVHYPGDVVLGSVVGSGTAHVAGACDRRHVRRIGPRQRR